MAGFFNARFLDIFRQVVNATQQFFGSGYSKSIPTFIPALILEPSFEGVVHVGRRVQEPSSHDFLSGDFG